MTIAVAVPQKVNVVFYRHLKVVLTVGLTLTAGHDSYRTKWAAAKPHGHSAAE